MQIKEKKKIQNRDRSQRAREKMICHDSGSSEKMNISIGSMAHRFTLVYDVTKLNKTVLSNKGLETALGELVRNKSVTNLGPMNQINPTTISLIYKAFQIL
jgi:hypothetical protein